MKNKNKINTKKIIYKLNYKLRFGLVNTINTYFSLQF